MEIVNHDTAPSGATGDLRLAARAAGSVYHVVPENGGEPFEVVAKGRDAWALHQLISAGKAGCTTMQNPAPRWSAYVHNLRKAGVPIETVHEPHGGAYPGTHGRYILRAKVQRGGRVI